MLGREYSTMLLTHKILSKLRDPLGRKKLGELRYKVYRLEGLLELVAEDPLNAWLYRNRVERMDATVEIYDEFKNNGLYDKAKEREEDLINLFYSLYDPISVPAELKQDLMSIFKEELNLVEY